MVSNTDPSAHFPGAFEARQPAALPSESRAFQCSACLLVEQFDARYTRLFAPFIAWHLYGGFVMASDRTSRRKFMLSAGVAGASLLSPAAFAEVQGSPELSADEPKDDKPDRSPDAVLARLLEGNKRFVNGKTTRVGRKPADFAEDARGQAPGAIIVACADSRVSPELIFDQGVGDLFVVRVAGNVISGSGPVVKGSIEFAVAELGARLILVLGHSKCGAVKAAIEHIKAEDKLPGAIGELVKLIRPAVAAAKGKKGDQLENVTKANVLEGVKRLEGLEPILSKAAKAGKLKVVGGIYELSTGKVVMLS
jgi:carbonic anhydrase